MTSTELLRPLWVRRREELLGLVGRHERVDLAELEEDAGDPYGSLRKALRADIDEAAWATLYTTVSRPFPTPETGKIAVKVINHYGDEVMKVFSV